MLVSVTVADVPVVVVFVVPEVLVTIGLAPVPVVPVVVVVPVT